MNTKTKSRRHFLLRFFSNKEEINNASIGAPSGTGTNKTKMLTSDGKLVEVTGVVRDGHKEKKKTSNAEILKWMGINKNG